MDALGEKYDVKRGIQFKSELLQHERLGQLSNKSRFNIDTAKLKNLEHFAIKPVKRFRVSINQKTPALVSYRPNSRTSITKEMVIRNVSPPNIYNTSTRKFSKCIKTQLKIKKRIEKKLALSHDIKKKLEEKQKKWKSHLKPACFSIDLND